MPSRSTTPHNINSLTIEPLGNDAVRKNSTNAAGTITNIGGL
jgi:hypothetical protein